MFKIRLDAGILGKSIITLFILCLCAGMVTGCQSEKTVYVDTGAMFARVNAYIAIRDSVSAFNESWKKPAMALKDSVDQYMQKLSALKSPISDKERAELEKEFRERQERFQTFAQANQKKASEKEKSMMDAAVKKTNALLQSYCEKKKYSFILGTTSTGSILAADRSLNVTEEIIAYLNEQIK